MTELTGLLDGETAEALRGLYGVKDLEASQPSPEVASSWDEYADSSEAASYCDRCAGEFSEDELEEDPHSKEMLCDDCDRRANTHAVDRFRSISPRDELELD